MNSILDITGKDIEDLNDSDLRTLIGLLCEAEVSYHGLQTSGVTWGGAQNAADGGIDVNVKLSDQLQSNSYIPRSNTGFQVKTSDMPAAAITKEMKPKGKLRDAIKEIIELKGAYIIISSQSSTTYLTLRRRVQAMKNAVSGKKKAQEIYVDYYDQGRIANWVRSHPSIVLWIREKLGRSIRGWQPYNNWAKCPEGIESDFIIDDEVRFKYSSAKVEVISIIDGINKIRKLLHRTSSIVRLTGLSGVGKTRLLQALFDERIGELPLNKLQVFYTDISNSPDPDPFYFAEQLISLRSNAILAIDNCPPELHKRLTSLCAESNSQINLITVEYDVREDEPEETEVFCLEPASTGLIEKLILSRFKHISQVNARTIAIFSGGNARIAIALANTVKHDESLSRIKDNELFNRLFYQRNKHDGDLLKAAETCSLVYSFECNTENGHNKELQHLSSLVCMSINELYRHISELMRRELIQKRGNWRAVLPPAIANRLASNALENIPITLIKAVFEQTGNERLIVSFSRRLSYLHDSDKAIEIALNWLSEGRILSDLSNYHKLGIDLLKNIAPIVPEAVIDIIEKVSRNDLSGKFLSRDNIYYYEYSQLLRHLAYDKDLFTRAASLLCKFVLTEKINENYNSIKGLLKSLFYIYLSGTHATPEQRLEIITDLLATEKEGEVGLAIDLLGASLETVNFNSHYTFDFGARSRDYGYRPNTRAEINHWYKLYIDFTEGLISANTHIAPLAKSILAKRFRGLWSRFGFFDELENLVNSILKKGTWNEGWMEVKETLSFDGPKMDPETASRLNKIGLRLEPSSLIELIRMYALSSNSYFSYLSDVTDGVEHEEMIVLAQEKTRNLGRQLVSPENEQILNELMPEILTKDGLGQHLLGQGMAEECIDIVSIWNAFKKQIASSNTEHYNYNCLLGFLNGISIRNKEIADTLLDDALQDQALCRVFPILQSSVLFNKNSMNRILFAIENDLSPIEIYLSFSYNDWLTEATENDRYQVIKLIKSKPKGETIAIKILYSLVLHNKRIGSSILSSSLSYIGQQLLLDYQFLRRDGESHNIDHAISSIIEYLFSCDSFDSKLALQMCKNIAKAYSQNEFYSIRDYHQTIDSIVKYQPISFLDGFIDEDFDEDFMFVRDFSEEFHFNTNPLNKIEDELILNWCEMIPTDRYLRIATKIQPFQFDGSSQKIVWTELAMEILKNSSDPILVLDEFASTIIPMSWSGSRADILQNRIGLFASLKLHNDPRIVEWAVKNEVELNQRIIVERNSEQERESERNERFE